MAVRLFPVLLRTIPQVMNLIYIWSQIQSVEDYNKVVIMQIF